MNFLKLIGIFAVIFSIIFQMAWFGIIGIFLVAIGVYFEDDDDWPHKIS